MASRKTPGQAFLCAIGLALLAHPPLLTERDPEEHIPRAFLSNFPLKNGLSTRTQQVFPVRFLFSISLFMRSSFRAGFCFFYAAICLCGKGTTMLSRGAPGQEKLCVCGFPIPPPRRFGTTTWLAGMLLFYEIFFFPTGKEGMNGSSSSPPNMVFGLRANTMHASVSGSFYFCGGAGHDRFAFVLRFCLFCFVLLELSPRETYDTHGIFHGQVKVVCSLLRGML